MVLRLQTEAPAFFAAYFYAVKDYRINMVLEGRDKMKKSMFKDILITGFAMFAIFFGSGNLIFSASGRAAFR